MDVISNLVFILLRKGYSKMSISLLSLMGLLL